MGHHYIYNMELTTIFKHMVVKEIVMDIIQVALVEEQLDMQHLVQEQLFIYTQVVKAEADEVLHMVVHLVV